MESVRAGRMTLRHVGLVALEAVLVTMLVWLAAMTLAGMSPSGGGIAGTADAGRAAASLTIPDGSFGRTTVAEVVRADADSWIHATCTQGGSTVLTQWARLDDHGQATLQLGPTSTWSAGAADCAAEAGWFATNGRWRVEATTTFSVRP